MIKKKLTGLGQAIYKMEFNNPTFNKGLNITVRFGYKWAILRPNMKFIIMPTGQEARVERVLICRFKDIPREDLKYEHDPNCRNYETLRNYLYATYPEFNINKENSIVTVIYFKLIK